MQSKSNPLHNKNRHRKRQSKKINAKTATKRNITMKKTLYKYIAYTQTPLNLKS